MVEASETVRVIGPGQAMFFELAEPVLGAENAAPNVRDAAAAQLRATWTGSMQFDSRHGLAQFIQRVALQSTSNDDTARLSADDVRVGFSDDGNDATPDPQAEAADILGRSRVIRSLDATGNVVFLSENRPAGILTTSVQIKGDMLRFVNVTEKIQVER